jgi:hypothetical protein
MRGAPKTAVNDRPRPAPDPAAPGGEPCDEFREVSLSLPSSLLDSVFGRVGTRGLSAYVTEALLRQEHLTALGDFHQAMDLESGPARDRAIAEANRRWLAEAADDAPAPTPGGTDSCDRRQAPAAGGAAATSKDETSS